MRNEYVPQAEGLGWVAQAACRGMDPDDFFVDAGRIIEDDVLDVCRRCPVRLDCLSYAYDRNFVSGYFGGFSPGQRRNLSFAEALELIDDEPTEPASESSVAAESGN